MKTATGVYQYTECGLDNVYLVNGFEYVAAPGGGKRLVIKNIDGLHDFVGAVLVDEKRDLSGKELRFLRNEMLMSQATLAALLNVTEQTVHRWETGKTHDIPKPAESLIRLLYKENKGGNEQIRSSLKKIAQLEDEIDRLTLETADGEWQRKAA